MGVGAASRSSSSVEIMTTPYERARAVLQTRVFLQELCSEQATPDVPESVQQEARALLRHFPEPMYVESIAKLEPSVFEMRREQPPTDYERRYWWRVISRGLLFSIAFFASLYGLAWLAVRYSHH
jgi:hypothetical protein